jgi:hypothetical protein
VAGTPHGRSPHKLRGDSTRLDRALVIVVVVVIILLLLARREHALVWVGGQPGVLQALVGGRPLLRVGRERAADEGQEELRARAGGAARRDARTTWKAWHARA